MIATINNKELAAKRKFAEACLRNRDNMFKAALYCSKGNYQLALQIVDQWGNDSEVFDIKEQLIAEYGYEAFLPSKGEILSDIYHRANHCMCDDDYTKLMKLAADMRGHIEKPGTTINNNITTNKVMNIPVLVNNNGEQIDDDEWGQKLLEQQRHLQEQELEVEAHERKTA